MHKKRLIRQLKNVSEETVEQISQTYPGLTDADHERLFLRIEQRLADTEEQQDVQHSVIQEVGFPWARQAAAVAACLLVCTATFASVLTLKNHSPSYEQTEISLAHTIGERYAAVNLTQSGTLWMTVNHAEQENDLYHVTITLENQNAVSFAEQTIGQPYLFMADNFMIAVGHNGKNWITVQPCAMHCIEKQDSAPYAFSLYPNETCELELWYKLEELSERNLVTSYSDAYPYTVITTKED